MEKKCKPQIFYFFSSIFTKEKNTIIACEENSFIFIIYVHMYVFIYPFMFKLFGFIPLLKTPC